MARATKSKAASTTKRKAVEPRVLVADKAGNTLSVAVPRSVAERDYSEYTIVAYEDGTPIVHAAPEGEVAPSGDNSGGTG